MGKENRKSIIKEAVLDYEEEQMEDDEMSQGLKNIMNDVTDMLMETTKCFNNPRGGRLPSDAIRDMVNNANQQEENDEELE